MKLVAALDKEHEKMLSRISELSGYPPRCLVTKRAMEDLVKLRLTKNGVLEAVSCHLDQKKPIYVLIQEQTGRTAYVLLPCLVDPCSLYVKVQLQPAERECDEELVIISAHIPKYDPPREIPQ